jgi:multiple sugar transport system substrate-binding protein
MEEKMKRALSVLLIGMTAVSMLGGCGSTKNAASSSSSVDETTAAAGSSTKANADYKGTLEVWGWTTDPEYQVTAFEKAYPNVKVNYTQIGTDYDTKIQTVIENGTKGPDVFYSDVKNVKYYIDADAWENLSAAPYNADTSDEVPYCKEVASDADGNVRALTYQATPGGFWYKRDLAKKYLGTDDPAEVSKMLSTMDGLMDAAEKIKTGSGDKTHMFAGTNDLWTFANYGYRTSPWVTDGNFTMDPYISDFFDLAKKVRDNDYDAKLTWWSDEWIASTSNDSVFGYCLPTWGLEYVIQTGAPNSKGNWGLASMPKSYFNGGSFLGIYKGSKNKDLAWLYVNFVGTNKDFLTQFVKDKSDYTSSVSVNEAVSKDYTNDWCGGQNTMEYFNSQLESINTKIVTKYDDTIGNLLMNNVNLYLDGTLTKDAAIAQFKDDVSTNCRDVKVN